LTIIAVVTCVTVIRAHASAASNVVFMLLAYMQPTYG